MKPQRDTQEKLNFLIGPDKERAEMNGRIQSHLVKITPSFPQRIQIIGVGNMIGEEDASQHREYTTTCHCISHTGILLAIKTEDFFFRVKTNDETWNYISSTAK